MHIRADEVEAGARNEPADPVQSTLNTGGDLLLLRPGHTRSFEERSLFTEVGGLTLWKFEEHKEKTVQLMSGLPLPKLQLETYRPSNRDATKDQKDEDALLLQVTRAIRLLMKHVEGGRGNIAKRQERRKIVGRRRIEGNPALKVTKKTGERGVGIAVQGERRASSNLLLPLPTRMNGSRNLVRVVS